MERVKGIEPSQPAWKAGALPLSYTRTKKIWSGRRDSNPRPSPWQGDALPLSHFRIIYFYFGGGDWIRTSEGVSQRIYSPSPLANSGTPPHSSGAGERNRTPNLLITSQLLCLLSYASTSLATRKGLEPSTSSVTGWHSNRLNYRAVKLNGGRNRARTYDPLLVRQVLSQLSYAPILVTLPGFEPGLPP
jgi:hypothetical protein